ncbi:M16 family metallopeptidase [Azospirillum doebereinerae]|uniref:Insulinase family protein n=2 Tax=Azospirillum doebereinerae TaxID=92933 RepID=A0A433JDM3_9PROT|nr:pitrilysin family protein [Azospirillum doebereinerae]MCG5240006.1 insulinase family protein [Azospirillum doebereinerae]RUQ74998.1 insulinase family protein [Azospirillum doebereinerae]
MPAAHPVRRLVAAGLLALTVSATPPALAAEKGVFFPESFTLANGMQVVVIPNRRVPVVNHMVWYKVGAADEERGVSGIAHFLEHLMFKGTDAVPPGAFSRIVAKNGGRDNAFTSYDYTAYHQNVARDRLELVMRMEADRMANLKLTDAVVYPERDVIIEERRQRVENEPADRIGEQINATMFVHHPYGTPVIGWPQEMANLTREEAERFYKTWYAPNNAILVVSGDVSADELKPLAEKYYGAIPARPVPERRRVVEPPISAERRVTLRDAEVRQPSVRRTWIAPSYRLDPDKQAYPLQVLAEIMSGGSTSRLYRSLVVEQKIATSAWLGYGPGAWDMGTLSVGATPAAGVEMDKLETALWAEIAKVVETGVTEEEVATARKRMLAEAAYARDSLTGPAQTLGSALATGQSLDDVENWPVRIDAVTAAQVNAAARAVLSQTNHVTGLLLPLQGKDS